MNDLELAKGKFPTFDVSIKNASPNRTIYYAKHMITLSNEFGLIVKQLFGHSDKSKEFAFSDSLNNALIELEERVKIILMILSHGESGGLNIKFFRHDVPPHCYGKNQLHFYCNDKLFTYEDGDSLEMFIRSFDMFFVDFLEGVPVRMRDAYSTTLLIDGISVEDMFRRAKKIRIQIIE